MLDWLLTIDAGLFQWGNTLPHPVSVTWLMQAASALGTGSAVWLALAGVVALRGDPAGAFRTALALLVTAVVATGVLKPLIDRDRPADQLDDATVYTTVLSDSSSFPSGHAAAAAAGAYALTRVGVTRWIWGLAVVIAVSRVYLGVHYPGDVLAGLGVGLACTVFVTGGRSYHPRSRARTRLRRRPARRPPR